MAIATLVLVTNPRMYKLQVKRIIPWMLASIIIAALYSASLWLDGIQGLMSLKVTEFNLLQVVKDAFEATAGLVLFQKLGIYPVIANWEDSADPILNLRFGLVTAILVADLIWSGFIFFAFQFGPSNLTFANDLLLNLLGAITEEMYARLFLLGLVLYLFKEVKGRWVFAVMISSALWAVFHIVDGSTWVKALQVFPFGLALGWFVKKHGFEASVFMHIISNVMLITLFRIL